MGGLKTEVDIIYNALTNSPNVQLTKYPAALAGVVLTASGMTTGAYKYAAAGANQVQVIALGVNVAGMWVCGAGINTASAPSVFNMWIGRGTIPGAVLLVEMQVNGTTLFLPIWIFVTAGVGIALDLASSNVVADDTANGHIVVATGVGA